MSSVQEHLKKLIAVGVTQLEIQEKTGVSQATISRILSGDHSDPRMSTAQKIMSFRVPRRKPGAAVQITPGSLQSEQVQP